MMDMDNDTEHQAVAEVTPLDSILEGGASDAAPPRGSETSADTEQQDFDDLNIRSGDLTVPVRALHRERERRQKMDARVAELEEELQRFNDSKFGFYDEEAPQAPEYGEQPPARSQEDHARAVQQQHGALVGQYGNERVAKIDGILRQLRPEQTAELQAAISAAQGQGDFVETVETYLKQAGLITVPLPIGDVLAGKKQDQPDQVDPRLASLDQREQAIAAAERRTAYNASRVEFVSEFGRAKFQELDEAATAFAQSGDPRVAEFANIIKEHPDPVGIAAHLLMNLGIWSPHSEQPAQQRQQPARVMPSKLTNVRNVAARSGPAFSGPTPLNEIFKRAG